MYIEKEGREPEWGWYEKQTDDPNEVLFKEDTKPTYDT